MKKIATHALMIAGLFVLSAVMSSGQTIGLRVNVPFEFNVGDKVLPAGHYLILAPQGGTLKIFGPNGEAAVAMTNQVSGRRPEGGRVDFDCYGKRCFLSQFWTERTQTGQEILKGRLEKEAATGKEPLTVIALRGEPYRQSNSH